MEDHREAPPFNPLPPVVTLLFAALILPELAFMLGGQGLIGGPEAIGWRLAAAERYGFSGDLFDWMMLNGRWIPGEMVRFVTYSFVHSGFTATLFAAVLTLALGKMVGETLGQIAVLVLFLGGSIFGALVYALLLNDPEWLLGGFPAVYGLIGGYSFVMWVRLGATGEQQLRAFSLIAMLMGLQLIFGVFFGPTTQWVADLAGFVFGFAASALLVPGGMTRLIRALRRE
ncbi:rhomboid family intramembrane serine protease [Roseobacter sp.]|uniref:rhomboid family intramembrane serine protease n=1 Tax=Roseobacter sp. TaxID=1907202 RepID=UPI0025F9AD99|nr:rhomboid family intramembrane serine protease [Roseobacter sp.]